MRRSTVEIRRFEEFPYGYWTSSAPREDSPEVLNAIVEWGLRPENANQWVYRHTLRHEYENLGDEESLSVANVRPKSDRGLRRCDLVFYVDIYHQDR